MSLSRRHVIAGFAAAPLLAIPAQAQVRNRMRIAHTASPDWSTVFVAREEGLFDKVQIDADFVLVPVSSAVPAALQSGSVQVGGTSPPTLLQAIENGLDLIVIAGGTVSTPGTQTTQYAVRSDSKIEKAADFVGKRVGTPGLGSVLDVLFRAWLVKYGVDPKAVVFVEAPFPSHADILRSGSVDAVVTAEPVLTRIVSQGIGRTRMYANEVAPPRASMTVYAATRQYAAQNPAVIAGFQQAVAAAAVRIEADLGRSREIFTKFVRLPPEIAQQIRISDQLPRFGEEQLQWWIDTMFEQKLMRTKPVAASLIAPWSAG